jgi:hypothetical protein
MVHVLPWLIAEPIRFIVVGVWSQSMGIAAFGLGLWHTVMRESLGANGFLLILGLLLFWLAVSTKSLGMQLIRSRRLMRSASQSTVHLRPRSA